MKINNTPANQTANVFSAQQGKQTEATQGAVQIGPSLLQSQVTLLADSQIKLLLAEMARLFMEQESVLSQLFLSEPTKEKTAQRQPMPQGNPTQNGLDNQSPLQQLLPQSRSTTPQAASVQQSSDNLITQGFAAMVKEARSSGDTLKAFAQKLDNALILVKQFPDGLPENISREAARVTKQLTMQGQSFSEEFVALTGRLAAGPPPEAAGPIIARLRQLCRQLLQEESSAFAADTSVGEPATQTSRNSEVAVASLRQFLGQAKHPQTSQLAEMPPDTLAKMLTARGQPFTAELLALTTELSNNPKPSDQATTRFQQLCLQLLSGEQEQSPTPLIKDKAAGELVERAFAHTIPDKLSQAITKYALSELKETLMWLKLAEGREFCHLEASELRKVSKQLGELSTVIQRQTKPMAEQTPGQSSLNFMLPIYLGEEKKAYPAYIHISQDKEQNGGQAADKVRNTWLRLCMLTENIGMVDIMMHLYGKNSLGIRIAFGDNDTAGKFRSFIPEIAGRLAGSPFTLADFSVGASLADNDVTP